MTAGERTYTDANGRIRCDAHQMVLYQQQDEANAASVAVPMEAPGGRPTRRQTCRNHRPFATYEAALAHYVAQLIANRTDPGQEVYRCAGHWHHGGGIRSFGRLLAEAGWRDEGLQDG